MPLSTPPGEESQAPTTMLPDKRYLVLVVEDDPNHALLIKLAFEQGDSNAQVRLTTRAEGAIAYLQGLKADSAALPDIVVLDISMPGIGGMGFLEWWSREGDWDIPVIVFTSSDDPELAERCFTLGARDFKEKPADFGELVELVRRILERWRPKSDKRGDEGS